MDHKPRLKVTFPCLATILTALLLVGCSTPKIQMAIGPGYFHLSKEAQQSCLMYLTARMAWLEGHPNAVKMSSGKLQSQFEEEIKGLEVMICFWKEDKSKKATLSDPYLDAIERAVDAGFIKEYAWHFLRRDTWRKPSDLRLDEFERWRQEHLQGHHFACGADLVRE